MKNFLDKISIPIKSNLDEFDKHFDSSLESEVKTINTIVKYLVRKKGKRLRPRLSLLSAKICGDVNIKTYKVASLLEILHVATLVHDDVIDESNFRRGVFSINALWKNKISVLVGDFLLSRGLLLAVENDEFTLLKIMSKAVKEMSEGELLQIEKTRKLNITEEVYFEIIKKKTAALIAACCESGASSANTSKENIKIMKQFGENVGIAFQIKDDLFDYTQSPLIGKPTGLDIREKKMTLPLIFTLNQVDKVEKKFIINTIKNDSKNSKKVEKIIELVKENKGLEFAESKMNYYFNESIKLLDNFENNDAKKSLTQLVEYVVKRKK